MLSRSIFSNLKAKRGREKGGGKKKRKKCLKSWPQEKLICLPLSGAVKPTEYRIQLSLMFVLAVLSVKKMQRGKQ